MLYSVKVWGKKEDEKGKKINKFYCNRPAS